MPASLEPGAVLAKRFMLDAEHKRGGMGTVWRAKDLGSGQQVAVKILHSAEPDQAERFAREAALLANLSHAGIVAHVAHGSTESGVPYLVMEWLEGENVAERLARKPLSLAESVSMIRSAAGALAAAHDAGIVHRDLKPSNLFLRGGRVEEVVILDLGIARRVATTHELTRTGVVLGTPSYMSPEQAQGHPRVGAAADMFSLGCLWFECLTGGPPFVGAHLFTVLAKIVFEDAPLLNELRPEVPASLAKLVQRMLIKDPAQRLADARALLAAIAELGPMPDLPAPGVALAAPAPSEQELVSVILATPNVPRPFDETSLDFDMYGGEVKQLVDGTTVVTLGQRGGAATDLAMRAARCALRLREDRPEWHIALATGRGVPSERIHVGEAVDRASAILRRHREPGAIRVDDVTAGLLDARFQTRPLEDGAFLLDAEEPSVDPSRRLLGRPTACVGRERDLATLELALSSCIEETSPRAVLVVGPPGMGKTRLRHELLRRIESQGEQLTILLGQGDPIRSTSTTGVLGAALSRFCGIRAGAPEEESRALFEQRIGAHLPEPRARAIAFLGELCGVRFPSDSVPELRAARQNPRIMSEQIAQAWIAFLRAEARVRPVFLGLDDLQWADALTINLVDSALRELADSPLLVLALARPEAQAMFPELWAPRLTVLPLRPLAPIVAARFVREVLGDRARDATVDRIVARAAGNALYLEELIRAAASHQEAVPETVLAMLQARIGLLSSTSRRALRAASVFGETFSAAGVEALLPALGGTDGELPATLASLSRDEILESQSGERWRFRHVLMRDAAYSLFTAEDRETSHAIAAHFLESIGDDAAVVASHCERGGDRIGAVRRYGVAATLAMRRFDHAATIELVQRALALDPSGEDRGVLKSIEGEVFSFVYNFPAGWAATCEALALLPPGHVRHTQSLATSLYTGLLLGKTEEIEPQTDQLMAIDPREEHRGAYVTALGWASIVHTVRANRGRAKQLLSRMSVVGADVDEHDSFVHGTARYWELRFEEMIGEDPYSVLTLARETLRQCRLSGDRRLLASSLGTYSDALRRLGVLEEAEAAIREAMLLSEHVQDDPTIRDFMRQYLAIFLVEHGRDDQQAEAREQGARVVADAALGSPYHGMGSAAMALVALREGDLSAAEAHALSAIDTLRALGLRAYYPLCYGALLRVYNRAGDPRALELARAGSRLLEECGTLGLAEVPFRLAIARAYDVFGTGGETLGAVSAALKRIEQQASAIPDPALRQRFLTEVPENAILAALGR